MSSLAVAWRSLPLLVLLLLCLLAFAAGAESSDVVTLTDANFNELTKNGSWFVDFYAPSAL